MVIYHNPNTLKIASQLTGRMFKLIPCIYFSLMKLSGQNRRALKLVWVSLSILVRVPSGCLVFMKEFTLGVV